jgi:hypothetical protein
MLVYKELILKNYLTIGFINSLIKKTSILLKIKLVNLNTT